MNDQWAAWRVAFTRRQWNPFYLGIIVGILFCLLVSTIFEENMCPAQTEELVIQQIKNAL